MALQYINGQIYDVPEPDIMVKNGWHNPQTSYQLISSGQIKPIQLSQPQAPAPAPQPSQAPQMQAQMNRLTGQARDALYGGLLGYQSPGLQSGGSNPQSFAAPQGSFRFPFGLLNGNGGQ